MKTPQLNTFLKKVNDYKNAGAKEVRIPIELAYGVVLELSEIMTENHLITFDDLKEALLSSKRSVREEPNKKITGGTF